MFCSTFRDWLFQGWSRLESHWNYIRWSPAPIDHLSCRLHRLSGAKQLMLGLAWRPGTFMPPKQWQMELDLHLCLVAQTSHSQVFTKVTSQLCSVSVQSLSFCRGNIALIDPCCFWTYRGSSFTHFIHKTTQKYNQSSIVSADESTALFHKWVTHRVWLRHSSLVFCCDPSQQYFTDFLCCQLKRYRVIKSTHQTAYKRRY